MMTVTQAIERGYRVDHSVPGRPVAVTGAHFDPRPVAQCFNPVEEALLRDLRDLVHLARDGQLTHDHPRLDASEALIQRLTRV